MFYLLNFVSTIIRNCQVDAASTEVKERLHVQIPLSGEEIATEEVQPVRWRNSTAVGL